MDRCKPHFVLMMALTVIFFLVLLVVPVTIATDEDLKVESKKASLELPPKETGAESTSLKEGTVPGPAGGFIHGFIETVSVIIVTELGDKTWFIAAIMAMKYPRAVVFTGAMSALIIMTVLSALLGYATTVIPRTYTFYASAILFAVFGIKMLKEGWYMSEDEAQEEMEEVTADLKKREEDQQTAKPQQQDVEGGGLGRKVRRRIFPCISYIFFEALSLTFLAEWGDRSQLATIVLAARGNVVAVTLGGVFGHGLCTGLAVVGGKLIASRISVRTVTLIGGVVFLLFAISSLFLDPEERMS